MPYSIGSAERALHLALGILLVLLPLLTGFAAGAPWLRWGALAVGLVTLATVALRVCPLNTLLGVRTCRP